MFRKSSSVQTITCITGRGIQWRSSDIQVLTCCSSLLLSLNSQTHTLVWLISSAFTANAFRGTKWHRPRRHAANGDAHACTHMRRCCTHRKWFCLGQIFWGGGVKSGADFYPIGFQLCSLTAMALTLVSIYRKPQRKPPWPRANEKHSVGHSAFPTTLTSWSS